MKLTKMIIEHHLNTTKVTISDIPVFEDNPKNFEISIYLDMFINEILQISSPSKNYSFIMYLEKMMFCEPLVKQVRQYQNQIPKQQNFVL